MANLWAERKSSEAFQPEDFFASLRPEVNPSKPMTGPQMEAALQLIADQFKGRIKDNERVAQAAKIDD
jgi:hypothetical protein